MELNMEPLLEMLAETAIQGEDVSDEWIEKTSPAELAALRPYLGLVEPYQPAGFLAGVDRRSIDWANQITEYRTRFEENVFFLASYKAAAGIQFLYDVAFVPPEHAVDYMHWEYARRGAMRMLGVCCALDAEGQALLAKVVTALENVAALSLPLVGELIQGLAALREVAPEVAERLGALASKAAEMGQGDADWLFVQRFRKLAPTACAPIVARRIQALGPRPIAALRLEELNYLLGLQLHAPEHPLLKASVELTTDIWMTNPYFDDGLYLLVAIWEHPDYAAVRERMQLHLAKLKRVTEGKFPEPSLERQVVDEVTRLRAHMLLYRLLENAEEHRAYIQNEATSGTEEERVYLEDWIAKKNP